MGIDRVEAPFLGSSAYHCIDPSRLRRQGNTGGMTWETPSQRRPWVWPFPLRGRRLARPWSSSSARRKGRYRAPSYTHEDFSSSPHSIFQIPPPAFRILRTASSRSRAARGDIPDRYPCRREPAGHRQDIGRGITDPEQTSEQNKRSPCARFIPPAPCVFRGSSHRGKNTASAGRNCRSFP